MTVSTNSLRVIGFPPELCVPLASLWRSVSLPLPSSNSEDSPANNFQLMRRHMLASWRDLIMMTSSLTILTQFLSYTKMNFSAAEDTKERQCHCSDNLYLITYTSHSPVFAFYHLVTRDFPSLWLISSHAFWLPLTSLLTPQVCLLHIKPFSQLSDANKHRLSKEPQIKSSTSQAHPSISDTNCQSQVVASLSDHSLQVFPT